MSTALPGTRFGPYTVTGHHAFDPATLSPLDVPTNGDYARTWSHYQAPVKVGRGLVDATAPQR